MLFVFPCVKNLFKFNFLSSSIVRIYYSMPKAAAPIKRKKKVNGYEFPDPLPQGEILKDVAKKEWCLGTSIGKGGFGEIYAACEAGSKSKTYPYAIKIEPHANGPLFVERSFYVKVCKPDKLEEWKKKRGMKILGVPSLQGFGSHMHNNKNYRFVVMDRFGKDLWSIFLENNKTLSPASTFTYAIQILDALEYIHSTGYVHLDVKGANLLFGYAKGTETNLFLVDFGLACKFTLDKEFKFDPKKAHNGTIEYTSTDLHQGVATRRGDLEILGFNLLHWLHSSLPWEKLLSNPDKVFQSKADLMSSVKTKLAAFAPSIPTVLVEFMEYVSKLGHIEEPDYNKCRNMFQKALNQLPNVKAAKKTPSKPRGRVAPAKTLKKRTRTNSGEEEQDEPMDVDSDSLDKENGMNEEESPPKRSKQEEKTKADWRSAPLCEPGAISTARGSRSNRAQDKPEPISKTKTPAGPKPSWKDCPTIRASNIEVAGQYTRKTTRNKK